MVLRDICLNANESEWITLEVPPVCSVSDILRNLASQGLSVKGKTLARLSDEDEEVAVSLCSQIIICHVN